MSTVNEILNFNFSLADFQKAARSSIHPNIIRLQEARIGKLQSITQELGAASFKFTGEELIPQVFKKFKKNLNRQGNLLENFERRELRTLTYSLTHSEYNIPQIFSSTNELEFVFEVLEAKWNDTYLIGLIDCYLKNWESKHQSSSEQLGRFIFDKLKNYEGTRKVLKSLKDNIKFFDKKNGDVLLGSELALKNKQIREATKYLNLPDNWFSYHYFSKVLVAYYEKRRKELPVYIDELNEALLVHSNNVPGTISNKRVVSKLIIQANANDFATMQDKVKSIAVRLVGDPGNASHWTAFDHATDSEKNELKEARKILNEWITRQFINVFFEKCINDSRRKRFWLKYVKEILQFRVVGSSYIKRLLINDNRISEYVTPRFSNTNSSRDRNAALMFIMRNHLFIEFSDEGAFYAYKLSNPNAPSIEEPYFFSTGNLKTPSMPWLAYRSGWSIYSMSEEGRLGHNDGDLAWEDVAVHWLKNKAGINV